MSQVRRKKTTFITKKQIYKMDVILPNQQTHIKLFTIEHSQQRQYYNLFKNVNYFVIIINL